MCCKAEVVCLGIHLGPTFFYWLSNSILKRLLTPSSEISSWMSLDCLDSIILFVIRYVPFFFLLISISINGNDVDFFSSKKRVRQANPLSSVNLVLFSFPKVGVKEAKATKMTLQLAKKIHQIPLWHHKGLLDQVASE